jgi:hypothetical protein
MSNFKPIPGYSRYRINPYGQVVTAAGKELKGCLAVDARRFKLVNDKDVQDSCPLQWLLWVTFCNPLPNSDQKVFSKVGNFSCTVADLSLVQKYSKITVNWKEFEILKSAGLTSKEISDRMGISLSSLKRAKAAARCL